MKHFDMFFGMGVFTLVCKELGIETIGGSEIDKYAISVYKYHFPGVKNYGNARTIQPEEISDFDILTAGFPCQAFSIAGKRKGLEDTRGTLFYEIARIASIKRPKLLLLENVKGLLSHDKGRTFGLILSTLSDLGYILQWQVLNSKDFGVPQNRERVFIIGYLGEGCFKQVFPLGEGSQEFDDIQRQTKGNGQGICRGTEEENGNNEFSESRRNGSERFDKGLIEITKNVSDAQRIYDSKGIAKTLKGDGGGQGAKTGLYMVGQLKQKCTKRKYTTPKEINQYLKDNKGNLTIKEISDKLNIPKTQMEHYFRTDIARAIPSPELWNKLKDILKFDNKYDNLVTEYYEKEIEYESSQRVYSSKGISPTIDATSEGKIIMPVLTPGREEKRQNGRRFKENEEPMFTLTGQDVHGIAILQHSRKGKETKYNERNIAGTLKQPSGNTMNYLKEGMKIRRLTPLECERLMGLPDNWTELGLDKKKMKKEGGLIYAISDSQRYKLCGNGVVVNVVREIVKALI